MHENVYYFYKNANVDSHHLEIVEISSTNSKSEAGFKNCPVLWQLPQIFGSRWNSQQQHTTGLI